MPPGVIRMSAAEAVHEPGFDGWVEAEQASTYVPAGRSVWELGAEGRPSRKATENYDKRTEKTEEELRKTATYVAVTSRRWPGAHAWAAKRRGNGNDWADVRALNAEDLATWLECCPSVNGWLGAEMDRDPRLRRPPRGRWEPRRLRLRLFDVAGRLAHHAHRLTRRLAAGFR